MVHRSMAEPFGNKELVSLTQLTPEELYNVSAIIFILALILINVMLLVQLFFKLNMYLQVFFKLSPDIQNCIFVHVTFYIIYQT